MQKYKADMIPFSVPHNAHVQHKPKPLARTAFDLSKAWPFCPAVEKDRKAEGASST